MSRDWLLTLLVVMSPFLLGATIVIFAEIRQLIQDERTGRAAETNVPLQPKGSAVSSERSS